MKVITINKRHKIACEPNNPGELNIRKEDKYKSEEIMRAPPFASTATKIAAEYGKMVVSRLAKTKKLKSMQAYFNTQR